MLYNFALKLIKLMLKKKYNVDSLKKVTRNME